MQVMREAQRRWARQSVSLRLRWVKRLRRLLAQHAAALAQTVHRPHAAQTVMAEVLPLCEACRFLEREGPGLLRDERHGWRGRPLWLWGSQLVIRRVPMGVVLILAPSNYPLLLPGVQAIQALAAGNAVRLKPAPGGHAPAQRLRELMLEAGLDADLLELLPDTVEAGRQAVEQGADKVILTGSATTGRAVMTELARSLTPSVMELSGCDALIVRRDADLDLAVKLIAFGLTLNAGATCIAPRRLIVPESWAALLGTKLVRALREAPLPDPSIPRPLIDDALARGAELLLPGPVVLLSGVTPAMAIARCDLFAPVASLMLARDDDHAVELANDGPFALGACVVSRDVRLAGQLARRLRAGCVTINDLIVPTADPRVPFGGSGESGFGVTRGAQGLLELTRPQSILTRRGSWRPHLNDPATLPLERAAQLVRMLHR